MVCCVARIQARYSHPSSNVDIAAWDFCRSKEQVPTVAAGTGDLHGVTSTVRLGSVKGHYAALITVGSVGCPCCLVPSALKVGCDLGEGEGQYGQGREAESTEHDRVEAN